MYRLTKNIYILYIFNFWKMKQSNVWSEFTHHTSLSKNCDKLTQEEGEGLQFSGNARLGKESLRYPKVCLLQTTVDWWDPSIKRNPDIFFVFYRSSIKGGGGIWAVESAGIVSIPFQVSKSTKWCWSLSKCLKWLLYKTELHNRLTLNFQP